MSDLPIKITLKSGAGYDAPWVTVDAADPDDASFKLDAILSGDLAEKVIATANLLKAANVAAPLVQHGEASAPPAQQNAGGWTNSPAATAPAWSGAQQQAAPAAQGHPENKGCESCGQVLQFKQGTSKAGKPYKLWACPQQRQRGDGHTTDFVN